MQNFGDECGSQMELNVHPKWRNSTLLSDLDRFLAEVESRAYRTALMTTKKPEDALDIVQDSMLKLVNHYRHKNTNDWPKLFQRILQNAIYDWHRDQSRQRQWFWQNPKVTFLSELDEDTEDFLNQQLDMSNPADNPAELLAMAQDIDKVIAVLEVLPLRQRQAFLLRAWEGFDTRDTARVMGCTAGSVKTHFHRALQALKSALEAM